MPWDQGWLPGELEAALSPDLAPWEPTDPNGTTVTRHADDVDRIQARLLEERAHRLVARDRALALDDEVHRLRRRCRGHRADTVLAFLAGMVLGFCLLAGVLVYLMP